MKAQTLATIALIVVVLGLAVISITRPVPSSTVTTPAPSAAAWGGSDVGGQSTSHSTKWSKCDFDGNPDNDAPGTCPPFVKKH